MSGMIASIPGASSLVAKDTPQSTIIISSPHSIAVIFLPTSPTPPRKVTFTVFVFFFMNSISPNKCIFF